MKKLFINHKMTVIGFFIGGFSGYIYWQYVGCYAGTCMITSKPINSTLYFAVVGAFLLGSFQKNKY